MNRLIVAILLALVLGFGAVGCGVKGPPVLPDGQSDQFPRKYPRH